MGNSLRGALFALLLGAALVARAQEEPSVGGYRLTEFPAPGAAPVFKLLEAGEAPRRALRYRLAAGDTHKLVMTLRMSLGVEVDGRGAPVQRAPAMRMVFDCKVTEADEAQARFEFGLADPPELFETEGIPPAVLEPMKKSLASLSEIRGHVAMTTRGVVREANVEVGSATNQEVAQMVQSIRESMEQIAVPLPEEPVGIGARWRTLRRKRGEGLYVYQLSDLKVTRFEDEEATVTMAFTGDQFAPRQSTTFSAGGGAKGNTSMQWREEGYVSVDLTSPVPRRSANVDAMFRMNIEDSERAAQLGLTQMGLRYRIQILVEPGTP